MKHELLLILSLIDSTSLSSLKSLQLLLSESEATLISTLTPLLEKLIVVQGFLDDAKDVNRPYNNGVYFKRIVSDIHSFYSSYLKLICKLEASILTNAASFSNNVYNIVTTIITSVEVESIVCSYHLVTSLTKAPAPSSLHSCSQIYTALLKLKPTHTLPITKMLASLNTLLTNQMWNMLTYSTLTDPHSEFFLTTTIKSSSVYSLTLKNLPPSEILPMQTAKQLLFITQSTLLLTAKSKSSKSSSPLVPSNKQLLPNSPLSQYIQILPSLSTSLSKLLSSQIIEEGFLQVIHKINDYYFLADGGMWRTWYDYQSEYNNEYNNNLKRSVNTKLMKGGSELDHDNNNNNDTVKNPVMKVNALQLNSRMFFNSSVLFNEHFEVCGNGSTTYHDFKLGMVVLSSSSADGSSSSSLSSSRSRIMAVIPGQIVSASKRYISAGFTFSSTFTFFPHSATTTQVMQGQGQGHGHAGRYSGQKVKGGMIAFCFGADKSKVKGRGMDCVSVKNSDADADVIVESDIISIVVHEGIDDCIRCVVNDQPLSSSSSSSPSTPLQLQNKNTDSPIHLNMIVKVDRRLIRVFLKEVNIHSDNENNANDQLVSSLTIVKPSSKPSSNHVNAFLSISSSTTPTHLLSLTFNPRPFSSPAVLHLRELSSLSLAELNKKTSSLSTASKARITKVLNIVDNKLSSDLASFLDSSTPFSLGPSPSLTLMFPPNSIPLSSFSILSSLSVTNKLTDNITSNATDETAFDIHNSIFSRLIDLSTTRNDLISISWFNIVKKYNKIKVNKASELKPIWVIHHKVLTFVTSLLTYYNQDVISKNLATYINSVSSKESSSTIEEMRKGYWKMLVDVRKGLFLDDIELSGIVSRIVGTVRRFYLVIEEYSKEAKGVELRLIFETGELERLSLIFEELVGEFVILCEEKGVGGEIVAGVVILEGGS